MTHQSSREADIPLHELMSQVLAGQALAEQRSLGLPGLGTMQAFNNSHRPALEGQRFARLSILDFLNATLRGIGQVIFVNNPISGLLILLALVIQSPWVGLLSGMGVTSATLTGLVLGLDRATLRNGIFGYNGLLVGAALGTFGDAGVGSGAWGWAIATLLFSALTTVMMKTLGVWWAKMVGTPPLTLPFNIATLLALALASLPQPWLALKAAPAAALAQGLDWLRIGAALPIGVGQVFLAGKLVSGILILLAIALCTPLGTLTALLGGSLGLGTGLLLGIDSESLYAGLWGYNGVLCAMAIGGVFYAPNLRSVGLGAIAAVLSALLGGLLGLAFGPLGLPVLTVPFCVITIACFLLMRRSLPSLVPVALHAVTSPEEHWQRYKAAKTVITNFRQQLNAALSGQRRFYLLEHASTATKGDLRYLFNRIDLDQSGTLSIHELSDHLYQADQVRSKTELDYLFACMDSDGSGTIDFKEFSEMLLRHQRLMANYDEFTTYFLPIDANEDDAISMEEMNVAMASVGEAPLSAAEAAYLKHPTGDAPLTWNRFVEMLLVT